MTNIFSCNGPPPDIGAARIGQTQGPFCTVQLFGAGAHQVQWCAAGLLQSISDENGSSTEVIEWTPSWFGHRASIMELSLCRQSQYGTLVCCSCSLLLLWPTLDPSPSIVPSYQRWKHMMILKMVIMCIIITIIALIALILCYDNYIYYCK